MHERNEIFKLCLFLEALITCFHLQAFLSLLFLFKMCHKIVAPKMRKKARKKINQN